MACLILTPTVGRENKVSDQPPQSRPVSSNLGKFKMQTMHFFDFVSRRYHDLILRSRSFRKVIVFITKFRFEEDIPTVWTCAGLIIILEFEEPGNETFFVENVRARSFDDAFTGIFAADRAFSAGSDKKVLRKVGKGGGVLKEALER